MFIRQDPPFDMTYITSLHLLELLSKKVRIVNDPKGIRNAPEKILMLQFSRIIPPTLITRSLNEIKKFSNKYNSLIIKPLYGNGGESVFLLEKKDKILQFSFDLQINDLKNFTNLISQIKQKNLNFKIIRHKKKKNAFLQRIFKNIKGQ